MAIPGFFGQWLREAIRVAIKNALHGKIATLAFDLNGQIHKALNLVLARKDVKTLTQDKIEELIMLHLQLIVIDETIRIRPTECLIIAVDGVAPGAKLQQQRSRREKSDVEIYNRTNITPGTAFMIKLDKFIKEMIVKHRKVLPKKVIYSNHLIAGEGEHKIMDLYRTEEFLNMDKNWGHVLYGLDTDLIMLSLISPLNNILLARETTEQVIDIRTLRSQLKKNYLITPNEFVALMFLVGNDFVPHIHSLTSISSTVNMLLDVYKNGKYKLISKDIINWEEYKRLISTIAKRETEFLVQKNKKQVTYPSKILAQSFVKDWLHIEVFRQLWYLNSLGFSGDKDTIADLENITGIDTSEIEESEITRMCKYYYTILSWTYKYYTQGTSSINQDTVYPYHHGPMLADIAMTSYVESPTVKAHPSMLEFGILEQLIAVVPMKSRLVLPREIRKLTDSDSPIADTYVSTFEVDLNGAKYEGQGITITPLSSRERIATVAQTVELAAVRVNDWDPQDVIVSTIDADDYAINQREISFIKSIFPGKNSDTKSKGPSTFKGPGTSRASTSKGNRKPPQKRETKITRILNVGEENIQRKQLINPVTGKPVTVINETKRIKIAAKKKT